MRWERRHRSPGRGVGAGVVAAHSSGRGGLGSPGTAGRRFSSHPLSLVTLGKALSCQLHHSLGVLLSYRGLGEVARRNPHRP